MCLIILYCKNVTTNYNIIYPINPSMYDNSACSKYDLLEGIYFIHNMNQYESLDIC